MRLRCAAARPADFLCLAKESQQRKATPRRRRLLAAGSLSAGLINSLTLKQSSPCSRQAAPRPSEIAAFFAKIRRCCVGLALPYYSYCQRLTALSLATSSYSGFLRQNTALARLAVLLVLSATRRLVFWQSRAAINCLAFKKGCQQPRVDRAFPGRCLWNTYK